MIRWYLVRCGCLGHSEFCYQGSSDINTSNNQWVGEGRRTGALGGAWSILEAFQKGKQGGLGLLASPHQKPTGWMQYTCQAGELGCRWGVSVSDERQESSQ